jgi:hypothetical protein
MYLGLLIKSTDNAENTMSIICTLDNELTVRNVLT